MDVERAFSFGRQTVSLYRHSLSSETIRSSIVFGNRCKEGLVDDAELVAMLFEKRSRGGRPRAKDSEDTGSESEDEERQNEVIGSDGEGNGVGNDYRGVLITDENIFS